MKECPPRIRRAAGAEAGAFLLRDTASCSLKAGEGKAYRV
jgi:hypothetical protein